MPKTPKLVLNILELFIGVFMLYAISTYYTPYQTHFRVWENRHFFRLVLDISIFTGLILRGIYLLVNIKTNWGDITQLKWLNNLGLILFSIGVIRDLKLWIWLELFDHSYLIWILLVTTPIAFYLIEYIQSKQVKRSFSRLKLYGIFLLLITCIVQGYLIYLYQEKINLITA